MTRINVNLDLSPDVNYWELVVRRAELTPDMMMLIDERGRSLTFGQYRERAEEVAAGLADLGIAAGQTVSYQLPTTLECAVLFAALSRLGAKQNPIIMMLREAEVGLILDQLHSDWFLVPGPWRGFDYWSFATKVTAGSPCRLLHVPIEAIAGNDLVLPRGDPSRLFDYVHQSDVRWFLYTSGTTATPKGIRHTDASIMASSNGCVACYGLDADSVMPMATPMTHIAGMMGLTTMLRIGHLAVLIEKFDPVESPLVMARFRSTHLGSAVPFFLAYLAAQERHGAEPLFPDLKICIAGGAPLPPELHVQVRDELGGRGIINSWGLTECPSSLASVHDYPEDAFLGTVGDECPGLELRIVTSDDREAGIGEEGELRVRGQQLFSGYVDSTLDADAFDELGWFRTGDLGHRDGNGFITITGRIKDIIIRNAENISAIEIENVLHQHPAIADCAVIGIPDRRTGERCCAVVVLAHQAPPPTLGDLVAHCRSRGLAIQKAPEQLEIIEVMPRNSMGKILKQDLRTRFVPTASQG